MKQMFLWNEDTHMGDIENYLNVDWHVRSDMHVKSFFKLPIIKAFVNYFFS